VRARSALLMLLTVGAAQGCALRDKPRPLPSAPRTPTQSAAAARVPRACEPAVEVTRFQSIPKSRLDGLSRFAGFLTTPLKYLSTAVNGPAAWRDTGCYAAGTGVPVRRGQHSTDGIYTVDVAIRDVKVDGVAVPPGHYVRLEILPGRPSHASVRRRMPGPDTLIHFSGPLVWDKDKDADHPNGHMEIHPVAPIAFRDEPHAGRSERRHAKSEAYLRPPRGRWRGRPQSSSGKP
jgi:hypothetical protein